MCGIAGFYGEGTIGLMLDVIDHRGPDGTHYEKTGPITLGAVSLKIMDPEGPDQPFFGEGGKVCAALNGEIYNFPEIKDELKGRHFKNGTDTEVIAHAFEEWGVDCIKKFNGMFAIAISDGETLTLVRDRFGQKPLYYTLRDGNLYFASEIKSLLTQIAARPAFNENFFAFETCVGKETLFSEIYALEPGKYLTFDGRNLSEHTYYSIDPTYRTNLDAEACAEELRELLVDAVALRLRSNVPLGIFLSGGLDSTLIAYLAKPQFAYSCRYQVPNIYDEIGYAELTARDIGAQHRIIEPTSEEFARRLGDVVWHLDQPVATAAAMSCFLLAEEASKEVKVVLTGEGSDEAFNGYTRHLFMKIEDDLGQLPELARYHTLARHFWHEDFYTDPAKRYYQMSVRAPVKTDEPFNLIAGHFERQRHLLNRISAVDFELTLPPLLRMADRMCSAFGVENRSPFLDHRIVELAFSMPPEMRIREIETKYILRRAARGIVPDAIIDRKEKQGLVTPINSWMENELNDWVSHLLARLDGRGLAAASTTRRGNYDRGMYIRLCLELWFERFFDRAS